MTTKIIDTLLLGLVAGVGIIGSICVFSNDLETPKPNLSLVTSLISSEGYIKQESKEVVVDYLIIDQKSKERNVRFKIKNFNPDAVYRFESGDGYDQNVAIHEFKYKYVKAGAYPVKLYMTYQNQKKLVASKNITIF